MLGCAGVTGKPISIGGPEDEFATGRGVMIIVREALAERGKSLERVVTRASGM